MELILITAALIPMAFINIMWPYLILFLSLLFLFSLSLTFHEMQNVYMTSTLFLSDPMSSMLTSLTIWICLIMFLSNTKYTMSSPSGKYNILIVISLFLLLVTFNAQSHFLFYLSFESTLIPIIFIIFGWGYQPERIQASTYLLFYTLTASLPLLLAFILMNHFNLTNNFALTFMLPLSIPLSSTFWIITILAFLVKMPCFFLHLWLPKAHVEAPMTGSMLLAAILLKLGSYGLMRMMSYYISLPLFLNSFFIISNLLGSIYTSIMCLKQTDIKALIAYSSVVHMSLMASSLFTFSSLAWSSAIILMLGHALCSSALFALASSNYDVLFSRSLLINKGLIMIFPSLTLWWFLFSAFNMSAPPSMNVISEIFMLSAILFWHINTFPLLIITTFLTGAYTYYLYSTSQHNLVPISLAPLSTTKMNMFLILALHLFPLLLLSSKMPFFIM